MIIIIILSTVFILVTLNWKVNQAKRKAIEKENRKQVQYKKIEQENHKKIVEFAIKFMGIINNLKNELKNSSRNEIREYIITNQIKNPKNSIVNIFYKEIEDISKRLENSNSAFKAQDGWFSFPAYGNHFNFFIYMIASEIKNTSRLSTFDSNSIHIVRSEKYQSPISPISESRAIKAGLLIACENFEKEIKKEEELLRKSKELRQNILSEKKKYERQIYLNYNKIKLEARYSETKDLYVLSIWLKEEILSLINFAIKSEFSIVDNYSQFTLIKNVPVNESNIESFFNEWHYEIIELVENETRIPKGIVYINYIDDDQWISWDYLSFRCLNHSWHFNLTFFVDYIVLKESESPHKEYMLNRSDFGPKSISHEHYLLAQYILSLDKNTFSNILNIALKTENNKKRISNPFDSEDIKKFTLEFNRKWNFKIN